ncbi:sigma-54 interaction domain-containing protein [Yersinia pseudotuberculosis]|uniref:Sigma-54 transcriptional regulatory protein n=2 Tax=Yersinia pseudotuberculosis TaxID=633 RepID=Q666A8_YERPS|nr:sigma-54 dependent transcriptional regulator [Yersinia pseudotuberculosis]AYW91904.1 sigma-54-dependent Fis family transcriptional regulator [Yersinia pseudotuberculosis]AYW96194.1 sigma-54-dependent Fis family transcriptional regulator [Yersinia pseudotuberculosis]KGA58579.1 AAA domain family protein [Yersinia pseudotuberculosis]MBO1632160.1 sigma-54-dependent Fis family transcriptional regulator [Yersinia pseudotuberculosis]MBP0071808.1 AAA domain-containing protein [Yersinia pseudotuberc
MMNINVDVFPKNDHGFVANAPSSVSVFSLARRVAEFNVPVLVTGETGTGKECVAKYIHQKAMGDASPYIAVNCAAIPESMLEAILFGYEKGAFTGAIASVAGKFEQANGGTLLLDEIGDMPLALQVKLLRVLQEQEVERLGGHKPIPLDIRIIASTNKDLSVEIAEGRFRQDLYYRLSVVPIHILPLRERPEDILPLVKVFINKYQSFLNVKIDITAEAQCELYKYTWPGNVRELENVIQRGIIMSNNGVIELPSLGLPMAQGISSPVGETSLPFSTIQPPDGENNIKLRGRLAQYQYIVDLLQRHQGNKSKTAAFLGITPRALRYRLANMREDGIDIECHS